MKDCTASFALVNGFLQFLLLQSSSSADALGVYLFQTGMKETGIL